MFEINPFVVGAKDGHVTNNCFCFENGIASAERASAFPGWASFVDSNRKKEKKRRSRVIVCLLISRRTANVGRRARPTNRNDGRFVANVGDLRPSEPGRQSSLPRRVSAQVEPPTAHIHAWANGTRYASAVHVYPRLRASAKGPSGA